MPPTEVSIPGADSNGADPNAPASQPPAGDSAPDGDQGGGDSGMQLAEKDAEIARLRALLGAKGGSEPLVMEAEGPNTLRYKAESKHLGYTTKELDKLVRAGKVQLVDHHVLCADGWYVNPNAERQANG